MNMTIKQIFDEIASTSGNNAKIEILSKYKENQLLKQVLYMANSKRVKFFIKQIPEYTPNGGHSLEMALIALDALITRKVTGAEATGYLKSVLTSLSSEDAYIIERIIEKDCKIGMGTTFMNKVFKDLIEDTPYMGAISFDEKKARAIFANRGRGYSQIKMDGRYCNAIIRGGEVELESRSGETTHVTGAKFLSELANFEDCVLNGELTMDGVPRYESNGMIASIIDICGKKNERTEKEHAKKLEAFEKKHGSFENALNSIRYTVWDTITVDEYFDKSSKVPYSTRLYNVELIINNSGSTMVRMIESRVVSSYKEAMDHFQEVLATEVDGVPQEGTILKAENGTWKDGKPTWQIKMKLEMDIDLVIVGFNYGTKGTKNENVISSLNCESSDGLLKTRPQGLKEDMMKFITENQDSLMGKVVQVKCNGLSNDKDGNYSLLYPAFMMIREDKDTCDSLESIKGIENMVKSLATA
jgi:ATP-dependent DNA ligase